MVKLFKKHNVVNVYFESNDKKVKTKDKIKEAGHFYDYVMGTLQRCVKLGDCYLFPYFSEDKVYFKVGVKNSLSRKQLGSVIKNYPIRHKKMETFHHWFDNFKKEHYTIEKLKFVGFYMSIIVKEELLKDRKFIRNSLGKTCSLSGDKRKGINLSDDEWLNLLHHMFLPLVIEYTDEIKIYQKAIAQMQYNVNKLALRE